MRPACPSTWPTTLCTRSPWVPGSASRSSRRCSRYLSPNRVGEGGAYVGPWIPTRHRDGRRAMAVAGLLALAAATVITVDAAADDESPVDPLRSASGEVFGPVESGLDTATHPIEDLADHMQTVDGVRDDNARLQAENARLRAELETVHIDRRRLEALSALHHL